MVGATDLLTARRVARLAQRVNVTYPLRELGVNVPGAGHPYAVALPADPDAPLDRFAAVLGANAESKAEGREEGASGSARGAGMRTAASVAAMEARRAVASGAHMPYWGLLWPSGLGLAEALLGERDSLQGARVLEVGCGLGVTATAALECGATLTAMDCFAEALLLTRLNALRNVGREPRTLLANWRSAAGQAACMATSPLDVLLAADVLYEEQDVAPLLELAPRLLVRGGTFWLAEPGRRVARLFVEAARARGWRGEEQVFERAWPPDGDVVRVSVHRFTEIV